jgi:general stress protein 26
MQPLPEPIDPGRVSELAQQVIKRAKYPMMATVSPGGQPRVRPVSPVRTDGFRVWIASLRRYNKTGEIEQNPRVELCYLDDGHDQVRITGKAVTVGPGQERQQIWDANPLLRSFLRTIDNPEFVLYRVEPERVRFMKEWALEYYEAPLGD